MKKRESEQSYSATAVATVLTPTYCWEKKYEIVN